MIILADNVNLLPYLATKSTLVRYYPPILKGADALLLLRPPQTVPGPYNGKYLSFKQH